MSQEKRIFKPVVLKSTFIGLDLLAVLIQALGIAIWAASKGSGDPDSERITLGNWITAAGLAVQLISFCVFTFLAQWIQRYPKNTLKGTQSIKKSSQALFDDFVCHYS